MNTLRTQGPNPQFYELPAHRGARAWAVGAKHLSAIALLGLALLAGCDPAQRDAGNAACEPTCGDACGTEDGCGGTCGCPDGRGCVEGKCAQSECGECARNETCAAGQCVCTPACDDNACGDDGCGGTCTCPDGMAQNSDGHVTPVEDCTESCSAVGWQCGVLCGERCGTCDDGAACTDGQCGCVPQCDGSSCSDGCGGSCDCGAGTVCNAADACVAPADCHDSCGSTSRSCGSICGDSCGVCAAEESCVDYACSQGLSCDGCSLRLQLLDRSTSLGTLGEVQLAVIYEPAEGEPRARIADLRIAVDKAAELIAVEQGPSLLDVEKSLFADPSTGNLWQERADGAFQLLAIGTLNTQTLAPGRVAVLTFRVSERGPVRFALQRRQQTLAPSGADGALQSTEYDRAVVVTP